METNGKDWRHDEARKAVLRRLRGGTHWSCERLPDRYKTTPEYIECIENGEHFDTLIGYVEQGGGMLNDLTATQSEQQATANREKLAPSYNDLWTQDFPVFKLEKGRSYVRGRELAWQNHVAEAAIGQMPVNHVTEDAAATFIKSLGLGHDGKSKLLQTFRRLSRRAIKAEHIRYCPFDEIKLSKERTTKDKIKFWHPETEYPLIRKHARDEDAREFFGFSMGTGARPNEALAFRWPDVDLENRTLTFRHGGSEDGATKGGKPVTVPMVSEGELWIRRIVDRKHGGTKPESGYVFTKKNGTHYRGKDQSFGLAKAVKAAGIKRDKGKLRYGFRHGFCVALANGYYGEHWSRAEAREMMRQDDEKMIDQYYRVLKPQLAEKAAQSKAITNLDDFDDDKDFSPKADGAFGANPLSDEDDFRGSERANPSESLLKRKGRPGTDRPFWKFAYLTTSLLVAWLCVRVYVAYTTTDFVWISSARLEGGLIQPLLLCATRFGAMHSPSGSLLTPRVSFWSHWRSFDRHVPCAAVVPRDLKVSRYRRFA